jgi:hypothetical protein
MRIRNAGWLLAAAVFPSSLAMAQVGVFQGHGDIGTVLHAGSAEYDAAKKSYRVTASGENMWATSDAFHFVWMKASGDLSIAADISFATTSGNAHKKAVLIIRQSLDAGSAYADAALHASGLTSLQARDEQGGATHEIQSNANGPKRLKLTKRADRFHISVAGEGETLRLAGGSMKVPMKGEFYIGIGVTAHDKDAIETAIFSNVEMTPEPAATGQPKLYSTLETITVASTDRRAVYTAPGRFEAPNWSSDNMLYYNGGGRLYRIPADGGQPVLIDTGIATRLNNDHAISPDGKEMAISDQSQQDRKSRIYVVPIGGGAARLVTEKAPSYFHGWSPDGKTLAYCAERNGNYDIYTIPAAGGEETRLTTAEGLDDGSEYSPDGQFIYFNSIRSGLMQIWRMKPDGSGQEQVTPDDGYHNWFAHVSPDNQRIVFLTYEKDVTGHPENKEVMLRLMTLADRKVRVLAKLFGGQGTINVPSWSPDGKRLSFVSYQLLP